MKMSFRGWSREVFTHNHEVYPVKWRRPRYTSGNNSGHININNSNVALGRITGTSLSGEFLVEFTFSDEELWAWLRNKIEADPVSMTKELGALYNESVYAAFEKLKRDDDKDNSDEDAAA